jgi:hypothetical protein
MLDLLILSPCFYPNTAPAEYMQLSAAANGLVVELYGVSQPFLPHGADAQVLKLHELMSKGKRAELVLVTDCRDVLFLQREFEIEFAFASYGAELVMSTERGCWPAEPELVEAFAGRTLTGYDYINAGQYIGTWDYVIHCLKHLLDHHRGKDGLDNPQPWWMRAKARGELDFALDSSCRLFQTMSGGADAHVVLEANGLRNIVTGPFPCSIHFNGNPGNDEPQREMYRRLFP